MCEFVSWIEKGKKIYFLTGEQVFHTDKGQSLRTWCGSVDDYVGHGAIRYFYGLEQDEGVNKEGTTFSRPDSFPEVIVSALKRGDFKGFPLPRGLLKKLLDDKYQADRKLLEDKYWADLKPLDDKYWADRKLLEDTYGADRKLLDDKYWADRKPLDDKYWADPKLLEDTYGADRKLLDDKYWADLKPLDDKYGADHKFLDDKYWADLKPLDDKYWADRKLLEDTYWDLFTIPENRVKAWR